MFHPEPWTTYYGWHPDPTRRLIDAFEYATWPGSEVLGPAEQAQVLGFRVAWYDDTPKVEVNNVHLPETFLAFWDMDGVRMEFEGPLVIMEISVAGGVPLCRSVTYRQRPSEPALTQKTLNDAPTLPQLLRASTERAAFLADQQPALALPAGRADLHKLLAPPRGRGKRLPDEHLREVARVYKEALARGERAPKQAVARQMHTSVSNAGRWIGLARKSGHLPPAAR